METLGKKTGNNFCVAQQKICESPHFPQQNFAHADIYGQRIYFFYIRSSGVPRMEAFDLTLQNF